MTTHSLSPTSARPRSGGSALEAARRHIEAVSLREDDGTRVGLELELHLLDLRRPTERPSWAEVEELVAGLPPMPAASAVTVEPGGQVELSSPPAPDAVTAVHDLERDVAALRAAVAPRYGLVALGADPLRPVRRINPRPRYRGMEEHFGALGCADAGRSMMCATAALQVNLDAGPRAGWGDRVRLLAALTPVLVALSATSPALAGTSSGWHSMRTQAWLGIDRRRSGACFTAATGDPVGSWAEHALAAPVMFTDADCAEPLLVDVPLAAWLDQQDGPAWSDAALDGHLSTLFPPVRPRGYLEVRCLDAMPDRWWPALVALLTVLVSPEVAGEAAGACARTAARGHAAARDGLTDPAVRRRCENLVAVALDHADAASAALLAPLADLLAQGRTPGDELRDRLHRDGALRLLLEEADA